METVKEVGYQVTNFMVDFETTGLNPMLHSAIEIALCTFTANPDVSEMTQFSAPIQMAHLTAWDKDTYEWWCADKQREVNMRALEKDGRLPAEVFKEACEFVVRNTLVGTSPVFWAKNAGFDWGFWTANAARFHLTNPFHYRNVVDLQSYMRGICSQFDEPQIPESWRNRLRENPHNALGDVIHQIRVLKEFLYGCAIERNRLDELIRKQVRGE